MASVSTLARASGTTVPLCRPCGNAGTAVAASAQRHVAAHGAAVPLVEVLHAVFHRALVGADLVVAALHQRLAAGVHAQRDLVVFHAGLHVSGLLGFHELAL